ncbi:hypothetical protein T03_1680 [Trichinella britovi]|uniref:Uncharacterized protein n=1 Tax=Trichinella britovi TaxID=45882 RepID=A0A0V1BX95_TRIBR|nr:hypothetical protein T03_1680 [Trichinella britovi]
MDTTQQSYNVLGLIWQTSPLHYPAWIMRERSSSHESTIQHINLQ